METEVRMATGEGGMEDKAEGEIPEGKRPGPRMQARQEGPHLRIEAGQRVQRDQEGQASVDRGGRRPQLIRKRDECQRQMERRVNTPRLNKEQMPKIKTGLDDLVKYEIDPLITEFQLGPADWDEWCAFEGAHEALTHNIRTHIL
jgi:hypothetical protein